jgi:molybdopterin synthase catalytic subunit
MREAAATRPVVRLLALRDAPLSADEVYAALADPAAGGITVFVGAVRDHDRDQDVVGLSYSAHPTALDRLADVLEAVAARHDVIALAALHRGEAFDACRHLIDDLKASVPIWKHQRFVDGRDEWVGTP